MPTSKSLRLVNCADCAIRAACALNRLESEDRARILPQVRERVFHRGDVLLEEGRTASVVRFVKLGVVFGYRRGLDGGSRPIGVVSRGGALGIFGTFATPNQTTCVALTAVRVCEVPVADLRSMSICGSSLVVQITRAVTEMFASVTSWSEVMRLQGVVNQLAYVLVLLADSSHSSVVHLPSHSDLAQLLGTRRETIARALRLLESDGAIRRHERKRCEVLRAPLLARLRQAD
jgi:CRP-like cAMP-binding protein